MDFEKDNREDSDDEQRMEPLQLLGFPESSDKFGHELRPVEGRGGLEYHSNLLPGVVESQAPASVTASDAYLARLGNRL